MSGGGGVEDEEARAGPPSEGGSKERAAEDKGSRDLRQRIKQASFERKESAAGDPTRSDE